LLNLYGECFLIKRFVLVKFVAKLICTMKIALVTNNYKPYSGGVVSSIDAFSQHLAAMGHQIFIITLDFEGLGNTIDGNISIIRIFSPVRFVYKTNPVAIPWLPSRAILQVLTEIKPDIVHSQHPFLLGASALKAGHKLGLPVVFTYHSQYEKFAHLVPLPQKITSEIILKLTGDYCDEVDGIVAPSTFIRDDLEGRGCKTLIKVIPSGILPIYLQKKLKYRKSKKHFELLVVSRFSKEKNLPFLLEMFAGLDDRFKLTIVGYGPERQDLMHMAYDTLNLPQDRVKFIIRPAKYRIAQLYKNLDLFVFASTAETQGLVLAEAMAGGMPVVSLAGPGQNDLVENNKNGFLVHNQVEMIVKILLLANDTKLHRALQRGAFESGNNYDSKLLSNRLLEFYQQVVAK
jgi:1,2-diacylglycerol 3-alpha-glucosyltransferase